MSYCGHGYQLRISRMWSYRYVQYVCITVISVYLVYYLNHRETYSKLDIYVITNAVLCLKAHIITAYQLDICYMRCRMLSVHDRFQFKDRYGKYWHDRIREVSLHCGFWMEANDGQCINMYIFNIFLTNFGYVVCQMLEQKKIIFFLMLLEKIGDCGCTAEAVCRCNEALCPTLPTCDRCHELETSYPTKNDSQPCGGNCCPVGRCVPKKCPPDTATPKNYTEECPFLEVIWFWYMCHIANIFYQGYPDISGFSTNYPTLWYNMNLLPSKCTQCLSYCRLL